MNIGGMTTFGGNVDVAALQQEINRLNCKLREETNNAYLYKQRCEKYEKLIAHIVSECVNTKVV